ncbi:MAG TPA: hypothetical protein VGP68_00690 [Gemmataceae bacterium]|jgi:hypothetical protein|nr:hypothetical protein [Gemmataceae bacterium]
MKIKHLAMAILKFAWPLDRLIRFLFALSLIGTAVGAFGWSLFHRGNITVESIEMAIQEEVPETAYRIDIEWWCRQRGFDFSYSDYYPSFPADCQELRDIEMSKAGSKRMITATVQGKGVNVSPIWDGYILVYFFFDKESRLAKHIVCPVPIIL